MSRKPELSVIMSAFNAEKFILRAVLSILVQSYSDFELIVVDDGSVDKTSEILNIINDKRLKIITQQNSGLTRSLNKALSVSEGRWVARHDADDFSLYNRFERQINFLKKNTDIKMLGSSCFIEPCPPGIINEIFEYPETHEHIVKQLPVINPFVHGSMIIDKKLLVDNYGYNEDYRYVQDYELWTRLIKQTCSHNLKQPLYVRSVHSDASQLGVKKDPIFNEIRNRFLAEHKDIYNSDDLVKENGIKSIDFYPALTIKSGYNKYISRTYYRMAQKSKKMKLPWVQALCRGLLYWPWFV